MSQGAHRGGMRLASGGLIDRSRHLRFVFDGQDYIGHPGDSLASALLANGDVLFGRSFKYHRPRGLLSAGAEEPNALVQLRRGARSEPNVRATQVELYEGLQAESQNRWPSLRHDAGIINNLLSPLFPAGFYYKTFMWPKRGWEFYEPIIRRAAGLGKAPQEPDPDRYDKRFAHADILVVGAGPAGLAAALSASRTGARVILADEQSRFGGALLGNGEQINDASALEWIDEAVVELNSRDNVTLLTRTTVTSYFDHEFLVMLERVADHLPQPAPGQPRQRLWKLRAKCVILATGALERPLVFAGNDKPGVMLAGAVQTYCHRYAVLPGRQGVVFTNNDSAYRVALDLHQAGARIEAVVDMRAGGGGGWAEQVRAAGIRVLSGEVVTAAFGRQRLQAVEVMRLSGDGRSLESLPQRFDCDFLAMSGGWNPTVHLFSQAGGQLRFDSDLSCFRAHATRANILLAGAADAAFDSAACLSEGFEAGRQAAAELGLRRRGREKRRPQAERTPAGEAPSPLWQVPKQKSDGKRFVDFQNDVTADDLNLAIREGFRSIEHIKRYTTTGMGTDQGKTSNVNALAIAAGTLGCAIEAVGTTTFRPPYTPISFGAIAGRDTGALLDPTRKTAMHRWHEKNGAVFEPVGQWLRPYYYTTPGESMQTAVNREVAAARKSLGIMDASTLGKIDIQGPDAAEFLNRVYTNGWSKLGVGRCRYGLMLHEDGMIFDDGVTARLADNHFHMTTTTGNAAPVLAWLENWLQTEWPDLRVYCTSLTEQYGVISLCGPNARRLLQELAEDIDLDDAAFPFMSWRDGKIAGLPARIFRVSFTGELSFEINVAAGHALQIWELLMAAGEKYAITPFGTEAMHVLRAEVGFIIVGQETDGTVTPIDLGLQAMVSTKKDFIGKRSLTRSDTARNDRKQLVGLLTQDSELIVPEGAQLLPQAGGAEAKRSIGHVTSSYDSPNCGRSIALALLQGGRARHGETILAAYDGITVPVTVTAPRFFDPEGSRARG